MTDKKNVRETSCGCSEDSGSNVSKEKFEEMSQMMDKFCGQDESSDCGKVMDRFRDEDGAIDCGKMMEAMGKMCGSRKEEQAAE